MRRLLLPCLLLLSTAAQAQHPAHHTGRYHRATPYHATAPAGQALAYYCASGNTVKYHSLATCRGLNRCSAQVKPMALSEAQAQMDACKICH